MITLHWYDQTFTADKAAKTYDKVFLYDELNNVVNSIINISSSEWNHISIEGDWTDPNNIPSQEEILRADMDFLTMENEYLEQVNEQQQADIDFCLMLLEE